ncbi:hypothetical protein NEOLEDRAFT_1174567 [Neolentinus lepideus HHB14362 ss-1]|uniref:Uncharacterized protein n=1 Tax=Neolentinus lepideus HHB14362 ss-1 TaxID=1314782 RepID=A0A165VVR5_9AGAM|nr:hypothetical protein NEOLEDRAFT_1174567 [Neolentinus lepideus HHB14362 ss-1]
MRIPERVAVLPDSPELLAAIEEFNLAIIHLVQGGTVPAPPPGYRTFQHQQTGDGCWASVVGEDLRLLVLEFFAQCRVVATVPTSTSNSDSHSTSTFMSEHLNPFANLVATEFVEELRAHCERDSRCDIRQSPHRRHGRGRRRGFVSTLSDHLSDDPSVVNARRALIEGVSHPYQYHPHGGTVSPTPAPAAPVMSFAEAQHAPTFGSPDQFSYAGSPTYFADEMGVVYSDDAAATGTSDWASGSIAPLGSDFSTINTEDVEMLGGVEETVPDDAARQVSEAGSTGDQQANGKGKQRADSGS